MGQRSCSIRTSSRAKNQCMLKRASREDLIHASVKWFFVLPWNHNLVPSVINVDDIATRRGRVEHDLIVWGPVSASLELPDDDQARNEQDRSEEKHNPLLTTQQQDQHCQNAKPDQRRQCEISDE